jgi:hypothetical protein
MNIVHFQLIKFIIMTIVGISFNPMNMLLYRTSDLYFSLTNLYGGMLMASNMMWAHELVHYFSMGHFNINVFTIGIMLSLFVTFLLLRQQFMVSDRQWIRRMIGHHSTALTTSHNILNTTEDRRIKNLARGIIETQEREITFMKKYLC